MKDEVTGTGILASFQLRSIAAGTSSVTMTILEIIDDEGQSLESNFNLFASQIHLVAEQ